MSGESSMIVDQQPNGVAESTMQPEDTQPSELSGPRFARYNVGYVYDPRMMLHNCVRGHSEDPQRISRIFDALKADGCLSQMVRLPIREVAREEALLVHSEALWDKVMAVSSMTEQDIADSEAYYEELSLYVHPNTPLAARLSCGGVIEAALAVARGTVKKSFAIVRPPGHHAEPDEHMGFCFFNNVSVATKVVQQLTPIRKILILDWDVHHGNGTQRAFYDDPSVLYISLHRYDGGQFYPNGPFGSMTSCGEGKGVGYSVNIPWPTYGMGDADYLYAFQTIVMPIALEFAPELVIISSGFDAADGDELGECHVSPAGYAHMTHMLSSLANGKLVVALEGGYNLDAISASALAVTKIILGDAPPLLPPMIASEVATETIWEVAMTQSKFWKNVNPKACDPREKEDDNITWSIPELLKAHRQDFLYRNHGMLQIPFSADGMEECFGAQAACTPDIMENPVLVILVHEFGNLRVELDSAATCDLKLEHSYLIDFSKDLIQRVQTSGHALLDINVFPKPVIPKKRGGKKVEYHAADVLTYIWDNYVSIVSPRKVVLVGHGPGCEAIMNLLTERTVSVMKLAIGVIQIVGNQTVPMTPRDAPEIRTWYRKHSLVIVPNTHRIFTDQKVVARHGSIMSIPQTKPIKLIHEALPTIYETIDRLLASKKDKQQQ
ncbi:histone deacetylase complex protein [Panus rudis PR-1116 ss-1]|nr:histone deacetylase complex protein [Panus rudis PR-1116 ss-1]